MPHAMLVSMRQTKQNVNLQELQAKAEQARQNADMYNGNSACIAIMFEQDAASAAHKVDAAMFGTYAEPARRAEYTPSIDRIQRPADTFDLAWLYVIIGACIVCLVHSLFV